MSSRIFNIKYLPFIKYIFVGLFNLIVGAAVYYFGIKFLGLPFWVSNFLAVSAAAICGYYLGRNFVFSYSSDVKIDASMFKYIGMLANQYVLSSLLISLFMWLGTTSIEGYFISIPPVVAVSYMLQKVWVFKS